MSVFLIKSLHGRFIVDHGNDNFSVMGIHLPVNDDVIVVHNPRLNHAFPANAQNEQLAASNHFLRQGHGFLDVFFRKDRSSRRNAADHRDFAKRSVFIKGRKRGG